MYLDHWGVEHSPFRSAIDSQNSYPSEELEEALARVDYLIRERRRVGVLLGERGVGKSTTLAVARERWASRGAVVCGVDAIGLSRRELLWQVAEGLRAGPDPADDEARLWRRLSDTVRHHKWQSRDALLLVDDADQLGADLMRCLVRLIRLDAQPDARWAVVLATDSAGLERLDDAVLHAIDLRIDLFPWSLDDTVGYVQDALVRAGRLAPVFEDGAIERLQELTGGLPRHVLRLADFALLAGAGLGVDQIDAGVINQAFEEISWMPPAAV